MLKIIADELASYLSGGISSGDLELWVVSNLQEILESRDQGAIDLANGIDVAFIRWNDDELDDGGLTNELARLYGVYVRSPMPASGPS